MTLFFWRKPKPPIAVLDRVSTVPSSAEFSLDKNATAQAKALLAAPIGRLMLSILQNESPMRVGQLPRGATSEDIHRAYGFEEGYRHCLEKLIQFGRLTEEVKEPHRVGDPVLVVTEKPIEETTQELPVVEAAKQKRKK